MPNMVHDIDMIVALNWARAARDTWCESVLGGSHWGKPSCLCYTLMRAEKKYAELGDATPGHLKVFMPKVHLARAARVTSFFGHPIFHFHEDGHGVCHDYDVVERICTGKTILIFARCLEHGRSRLLDINDCWHL